MKEVALITLPNLAIITEKTVSTLFYRTQVNSNLKRCFLKKTPIDKDYLFHPKWIHSTHHAHGLRFFIIFYHS